MVGKKFLKVLKYGWKALRRLLVHISKQDQVQRRLAYIVN